MAKLQETYWNGLCEFLLASDIPLFREFKVSLDKLMAIDSANLFPTTTSPAPELLGVIRDLEITLDQIQHVYDNPYIHDGFRELYLAAVNIKLYVAEESPEQDEQVD